MILCCISHQKQSKNINVVTYGDGKIRTYRPDEIDSRLQGAPIVTERSKILAHIAESDEYIMVPVDEATALFGWHRNKFDDVS